MSCNRANVPEYLHFNNKPTFSHTDFLPEHFLYRLVFSGKGEGNPIEFPGGTYTSLSCKWSLLINEEDVLAIDEPPLGNTFKYAFVETLSALITKKEKLNGNNLGWHKLTCVFNHAPMECDYSHCEVNIKHEIFSDENEQVLTASFVYTYEIWQAEEALLQSKGAFYKDLKRDYRRDIIQAFCHPLQTEQEPVSEDDQIEPQI